MTSNRFWRVAIGTLILVLVVGAVWVAHSQPPASQQIHQPSCGQANNIGNNYDPTPSDCLWRAYANGTSAQAIVVNYTTEGDPVSYAVNIISKGRIQVSIESQDKYGPQGSFSYSCTAMTRQPAAQLPGRFFLVLTGCSGPPDFLDGSRLTIP